MTAYSTVVATKRALRQLIAAQLPAVQVKYGQPAAIEKARECVWIGDTEGTHTVPVLTAGRKRREEDYTITVFVEVVKDRGTLEDAEDRCEQITHAVEDVLANDPSLGNVDGLVHAYADGDFSLVTDYGPGPISLRRFDVHCLARIT